MKLITALLLLIANVSFALTTGETAPDFKLQGLNGEVSLSNFKGKTVILEWTNHGCPFVKKHYGSGNMQKLQEQYTKEGVAWLSIISSAEGKQGYVDQKGAKKEKAEYNSKATDILLDPTGKVGNLYGAKTTPHMFIIDSKGKLVYQGAIDSKPDTDQDSIPAAKNYVVSAMNDLKAGKPVVAHTTKSYGCSVKY